MKNIKVHHYRILLKSQIAESTLQIYVPSNSVICICLGKKEKKRKELTLRKGKNKLR